ncbi:MAG TPA: heavy-metal-associated domain-containing protein [Anaerolineaceae bacterium]|jgi:copper chaperone|nr:heavy-metal-associated domain-containing protein [Anaerolineaceae bacterium]
MNKTYYLPNIHCQHCVHTVKMELEEIDGVEKVDVDLNTKKANVSMKSAEVEQSVLKTLDEIGYPAEL